jgi:multiple sugar transport system permease protein
MTASTAAERPAPGSRPRWSPAERRTLLWALLFLSPWIIGFVIFTAGPMLWSLWLSFTNYDPLANRADFIGLDNYARMLEDRRVALSLGNTLYFTVLYVPLSVILGLGLAMLLNGVGGRLAGLFRTAFYLPNVTPAVAVGTLFLLILNNPNGLLNQVLAALHLPTPSWLNDPAWIKNGIVLMMLWSIGGTVVILFAALRNVPQELYEAATVDGAGPWQRLMNVTVPMISGALFFVLVINTVASLQLFSEVYTMFFGQRTGASAAGESSALFYVVYLFRNAFEFFRMGYASALGWLLFVIVAAITFVQFRLSRRFVFYEGE